MCLHVFICVYLYVCFCVFICVFEPVLVDVAGSMINVRLNPLLYMQKLAIDRTPHRTLNHAYRTTTRLSSERTRLVYTRALTAVAAPMSRGSIEPSAGPEGSDCDRRRSMFICPDPSTPPPPEAPLPWVLSCASSCLDPVGIFRM
jgi:hypothetical protein